VENILQSICKNELYENLVIDGMLAPFENSFGYVFIGGKSFLNLHLSVWAHVAAVFKSDVQIFNFDFSVLFGLKETSFSLELTI